MISRLFFVCVFVVYILFIVPFASFMKNRPVVVKLGYVPSAEVLRITVGDQKLLVAHSTIVKVLVYFGTLVENFNKNIVIPAEYFNMYKILQTSVKLDPYNSDAYYFAQAAFTWEVDRATEVNMMLDYGMKYRTWDYMLPFFAGFNSAYFLKQYEPAAQYMQRAAEISGKPLLTNLAARYFYESRNSSFGINFLEMMENNAKDEEVKKLYRLRKAALVAVNSLQTAVDSYKSHYNHLPQGLDELVRLKLLKRLPIDPYGGTFYLDSVGTVRSTSKFAFGGQ